MIPSCWRSHQGLVPWYHSALGHGGPWETRWQPRPRRKDQGNGATLLRNVDQIRQAMHAQPFRPFGIMVADGTVYTVKHPDFIAVPPGMRPREIAFFAEGVTRADDYETHWI